MIQRVEACVEKGTAEALEEGALTVVTIGWFAAVGVFATRAVRE
jgi:hypothetical protein